MMIGFHQNMLTYWLILGIQHGLQYYRQYQERAKQALRLELHASEPKSSLARARLKRAENATGNRIFSLTPSTPSWFWFVRRGRRRPRKCWRASASLPRCVLEEVETQEIPLRRELEYFAALSFDLSRFVFKTALKLTSRRIRRFWVPRFRTWLTADCGECHPPWHWGSSAAGNISHRRSARKRDASSNRRRRRQRISGNASIRDRWNWFSQHADASHISRLYGDAGKLITRMELKAGPW